jgi:hypothetical protein
MANIKICDRCRNIFPEREEGSSHITSGIVYSSDGDKNLNGDMCAECTGHFLARDYVKGRHYALGELSDKETQPEGWQPQPLDTE